MLNRKLMIWAHGSISLVLTCDHTPCAMSHLFYIFTLPSLLAPSPNRSGVCVQHVFPWSCHHFKFQVSQYRATVKNLKSIAGLPGFSFSSASFQLCDIVWELSFCKMGIIITVVFCYRGLGAGERGSADLCANFHDVNTSTLAGFTLPTWPHWILSWNEMLPFSSGEQGPAGSRTTLSQDCYD